MVDNRLFSPPGVVATGNALSSRMSRPNLLHSECYRDIVHREIPGGELTFLTSIYNVPYKSVYTIKGVIDDNPSLLVFI